jgi:hypothetical protein
VRRGAGRIANEGEEPTTFRSGAARAITSFGPLVATLLAAPFGVYFNKPATIMTCFALLSIYAVYAGRETRADPPPR